MLSKVLGVMLIIAISGALVLFLTGVVRAGFQALRQPADFSLSSDKLPLQIFLASIFVAALILVAGGAFAYYKHMTEPPAFSSTGYKDVNKSVGCETTQSTEAADEDWAKYYDGHSMIWTGMIEKVSNDSMMLDMDGHGLPDLYVSFADHGAGHDLHKGDRVFVKFTMDDRGGCFMPFGGKDAVLVQGRPDRIFADSSDYYERDSDPKISSP